MKELIESILLEIIDTIVAGTENELETSLSPASLSDQPRDMVQDGQGFCGYESNDEDLVDEESDAEVPQSILTFKIGRAHV